MGPSATASRGRDEKKMRFLPFRINVCPFAADYDGAPCTVKKVIGAFFPFSNPATYSFVMQRTYAHHALRQPRAPWADGLWYDHDPA
jgi:hypothetical protein